MPATRTRARPASVTARHLWLAGAGLIVVAHRQARVAGERLFVLRTRAGRPAGSLDSPRPVPEPFEFSADVEARLAPVLDKLGLREAAGSKRNMARGAAHPADGR